MCDTIVALPSATKDGRMLFAKILTEAPTNPMWWSDIRQGL